MTVENHRPLVSVVVTTYNAAGLIRDALDSVLSQTARDFEVIVVDDASLDGTCQIVQDSLDGRCRYRVERLPANSGGPAHPRNVGVAMSQGRWIALLDSDDIWHPQKLEIELEVAARQGARFVSTEKRWFRRPEETRRWASLDLRRFNVLPRAVTHSQLCRKNFLCTSSVMAERDLFIRHPFPESRHYRAVEDYRCWLDIHRESVASHPQIQAPLVFYRVSGTSLSASKASMVCKHWRLYRDYYHDRRWPNSLALASMATYAFSSIYRQFKYRRSRC